MGVLVRDFDGGDVSVPVLQEDLVPGLEVLVVSVEDDGEAEDEAVGESDVVHDMFVALLVHESGEGGESAVHDELHVA